MDELKRRYLIYQLMNCLDWIGRNDDWHERSRLHTRAIGIIRSLGETKEAIFEMDVNYLVTDYNKFRIYKDRLNEVIDIDDQDLRENAVFEYYCWLHEIRLLRHNE